MGGVIRASLGGALGANLDPWLPTAREKQKKLRQLVKNEHRQRDAIADLRYPETRDGLSAQPALGPFVVGEVIGECLSAPE